MSVYAVCRGQGGAVDTVVAMARRFSFGVLFAMGFWSASLLLQRWMSSALPASVTTAQSPRVSALNAPIPASIQSTERSGGHRYKVSGFDQDTKFATTEFIIADSPSNAQLKVELKGVTVATIEEA